MFSRRVASFTLVLMIALASAKGAAEEPALKSSRAVAATRKFEVARDKIQTDAQRQLRSARQQYIADLNGALEEVKRSGNLDEGVRIRAAIDKLNEPETALKAARTFNGHHYSVLPDPMTWHTAQRRCEELGGHLVCITSEDEDHFVRELAADRNVWLGASDEATEGEWAWVSGEAFEYTHWAARPDNAGGVQNHACYWAGRGWDDLAAGERMAAVCEWDR